MLQHNMNLTAKLYLISEFLYLLDLPTSDQLLCQQYCNFVDRVCHSTPLTLVIVTILIMNPKIKKIIIKIMSKIHTNYN